MDLQLTRRPASPARRSRRVVGALAAALALSAAGCGVTADEGASGLVTNGGGAPLAAGSFEGAQGAKTLQRAAETTGDVTSLSMSMEMAITGMPMVGDMTVTMDGSFDNESGQGHLTMDLGETLGAFTGGGEDGGTMEVVLDGDTVYLKSALFSMLDEDDAKPWKKMDASEFAESGGGGMGAGAGTDPGAFLDLLKASGADLEEVGTEDVRGVATTHIRTQLDLADLAAAGGGESSELDDSLGSLGTSLEDFPSLPAEVWVDGDGYVRRFALTFDLSSIAESSGEADELGMDMSDTTMTMTLELYDFNEPVSIEVPPADQVGELDPSMLGGN